MRKNIITCPNCGRQFDISYARIVACRGCPFTVPARCNYVKCPFCGYEFSLSGRTLSKIFNFEEIE